MMEHNFRKKLSIAALIAAVLMGLAGCGSSATTQTASEAETNTSDSMTAEAQTNAESEAQAEESAAASMTATVSGDKTSIVVYFSATGTTKGVAEKIASVTDSDLYEIVPADPYTDEDLDYNDKNSRTTKEQNDKSARPEIAGDPVSLDQYDTVYIGYPIWWGEEPRIMDTFVEAHSFDGKTVIPFVTSGGSGIGSSAKNLEKLAGSGSWLEGKRFNGDVSEDELKEWIDGLGI